MPSIISLHGNIAEVKNAKSKIDEIEKKIEQIRADCVSVEQLNELVNDIKATLEDHIMTTPRETDKQNAQEIENLKKELDLLRQEFMHRPMMNEVIEIHDVETEREMSREIPKISKLNLTKKSVKSIQLK